MTHSMLQIAWQWMSRWDTSGGRYTMEEVGRWDTSGGRYTGGGGTITLITKDGKSIAKCMKVTNNLYQIKLTI